MAYQRVTHTDAFNDGSATDATAVVNAIETGLEAVEAAAGLSLGPSNGSDDTAVLNAILATGVGKIVRGVPGQSYLVSAPLIVPSGTTLDMTDCAVTSTSGTGFNMLRNAAVAPVRTVTDAAIASGATTLTSATAAFTSADVGRTVSVAGAAGGAGGICPLTANIVTVTNSTTVTVSVAAQATVTNASCPIFNRDTDIAIIGGNWHRTGGSGSTGMDCHTFLLRHIDRLRVDVQGMVTAVIGAKYAFSIGDVTDVRASCMHLDTISDGFHFQGPCRGIDLTYVAGTTSDDMVAFICGDWPAYLDVAGDISNVHVGTIIAHNAKEALRLISGAGWRMDSFKAEFIAGSVTAWGAKVGEDAAQPQTVGGTYGVIDLGRVEVAAPQYPVWLANAAADKIIAQVVQPTGVTSTGCVKLAVAGGTPLTTRELVLIDCDFSDQSGVVADFTGGTLDRLVLVRPKGSGMLLNGIAGTIGHVTIQDANINYTGNSSPIYITAAAIGQLSILGGDITTPAPSSRNLVNEQSTGGITRLDIAGGATITSLGTNQSDCIYDAASSRTATVVLGPCNINGYKRVLNSSQAGSQNVVLDNPTILTSIEPFYNGAGSMIVRGSVDRIATTKIVATGTVSTRVIGYTLPADVSTLTPVEGDTATNTSAAVGAGWFLGPVIYNASAYPAKWIPLQGFALSGSATLVAGTVTVANTKVAAYTRIRLLTETPGGTQGAVFISALTVGTSFTIKSTSNTDTSVIRWEVIAW